MILKASNAFFHTEGRYFEKEFSVCDVSKIDAVQHCTVVECVLLTTADVGQGVFRARTVTSSALAVHSEYKQEK